jgi:precorrin-2 dehydrogenase/sirohydrochlorin ferrochelatase
MRYYPIFANLENRIVAVVGGGEVAERKILSLINCGANVVVISPEVTPVIAGLVRARQIHHLSRCFRTGDLEGASLVIAATSDSGVNRQVAREAGNLSLFVNDAQSPENSTFIVPSVVSKKDLQIAISTSGQSPALARRIRLKLERDFGPEFDRFIDILSQVRRQLHKLSVPEESRASILNRLAESDILDLLGNNRMEEVLERVKELSPLTPVKI